MEYIFILSSLLIITAIHSIVERQRMKNIAIERGIPNICKYARSFDYRSVDTRIIREVWNVLQGYLGKYDGLPFPIEADDSFKDTYKLHPDDLDDAYWDISDRLGLDRDKPEDNPYWNKVTSVKTLVLFLHHQPRLNTHIKTTIPSL